MSRHNRERRAKKQEVLPITRSTPRPIRALPPEGHTIPQAIWNFVRQIDSGRRCDGCTACCTMTGVADLGKPPLCDCEHQTDTGCGIYGKHPFECREYACLWRMGWGRDDERPDKVGFLLHLDRHPQYPEHLGYSSVEIVEFRPGAVMNHFPGGDKEWMKMLRGDKTLIFTLHLWGTPRARPPYINPKYDNERIIEGSEDYVGNDVVMVQLGVMDRSGALHVSTERVIPAEDRPAYIEKMLGH